MTKAHLIKVYRGAAQTVAVWHGWASCEAIGLMLDKGDWANRGKTAPESKLYREVTGIEYNAFTNFNNHEDWRARQKIRVLNLLMMAEWVNTDYEPRGKK